MRLLGLVLGSMVLLLSGGCSEDEAEQRAGVTFRGQFTDDDGAKHGYIVLTFGDDGETIESVAVDADPARYSCPPGMSLPEGGETNFYEPGLVVAEDGTFDEYGLRGTVTSATEAEGTYEVCPPLATLDWTATAE